MSTPMYDLPEHLVMPVNADGNGPETDPDLVAAIVCWGCHQPWPCPQARIDAALTAWDEHLTATPGEPGQYRCECVGCDMGRALRSTATNPSSTAYEHVVERNKP